MLEADSRSFWRIRAVKRSVVAWLCGLALLTFVARPVTILRDS